MTVRGGGPALGADGPSGIQPWEAGQLPIKDMPA